MNATPPLLVYGANGYTGRLIVEEAVRRGMRPVLAGRDREAIPRLAAEVGLPHRVVSLDDAPALDRAVGDAGAVLHCAGPFSATARPMVEACLRRGVHYLDITGEIAVFEWIASRGRDARERPVALLPGVGFDVVPSDCLAAHVAARVPRATRLTLAIRSSGGVSRGTALTALDSAGRGGAVRRDGRIVEVPAAWRTRRFDFGDGIESSATTIPWGDVSTAWHSTGIPNIEVYMAMPRGSRRALRASRSLGWLLRRRAVRSALRALVASRGEGPDAEARARGETRIRAEVRDDRGGAAAALLVAPEGYTLTARSAVEAARRVLAGEVEPGFHTPSRAFGSDFVLQLEGVRRLDLETV